MSRHDPIHAECLREDFSSQSYQEKKLFLCDNPPIMPFLAALAPILESLLLLLVSFAVSRIRRLDLDSRFMPAFPDPKVRP